VALVIVVAVLVGLVAVMLVIFSLKGSSKKDDDKNGKVTETSAVTTTSQKKSVTTTAEEEDEEDESSEKESKIDYNAPVIPEKVDHIRDMYVTTEYQQLRIRVGPGYDYKVAYDGIPMGTKIAVTAEMYDPKSTETWAYVEYDTYKGWITETCLWNEPTIVYPEKQSYMGTFFVNTDNDDLTMRYGPGYDYGIVTMMPEKADIKVYAGKYISSTG
jgi:hypothetical protein